MNTQKIRDVLYRLKTTHFSPSLTAPFLIFLACFFSFGVLLASLGFFQDDWHHVYYGYYEGLEGLKNFFYTDSRPLAYGLYGFLFRILGFSSAHWHWSLMLLRFLTVIGFWLSARILWPNQPAQATWLALFFALHPVYTLQPLAVAYTLHWVSYLAVAFSFVFMLFAVRKSGKVSWLFSGMALLLQVYHLVLMEYFAGLELVRILLLWLALPQMPFIERVKKTLQGWLPYLAILILYAMYRLSYSALFGYDRFNPALLAGLANSPFSTLLLIAQSIIKDTIYVLFSPWYTAIMPSVFDLARPSTWYMLAGGIVFSLIFFGTLSRLSAQSNFSDEIDSTPLILAGFGFLAVLLALLPSWLVGLELSEKNPLWSSRLALPAMWGASMFTVGTIGYFVQNPMRRAFLLSILLGVAVSSHIQTARSFKESWDKQRQFYWQLYWRAPTLQTGTFVVADSEILFYMGDSPTAYAINLLYPKTTHPPAVDYWFNPGSENIHLLPFEQGQPLEMSKYSSTFTASSDRVLAITFEPQQGQCLWLLRPAYREVRFLTEEAYRWMAYSDLARVQWTATHQPPTAIFGSEPERGWCYHYQKADLAAQWQDWPHVVNLWQSAQTNGYRPAASIELLPFIEAYARTSQWQQARELTFWANSLAPRMPNLLCSTWQAFEKDGLLTPETASVFESVKKRLNCQP